MEIKTYIVTEADKLFSQYGFKSVTMDDIAKQLGISKKTIYQHFKDKDELVNVLMDARLDLRGCEIKDHADQGIDAVHEIFLGLADINEWLDTLNPKLFYDLQKYHPEAWIKFRDFKEKSLAISITNNLKRGIREDLYRDTINIEILTELRLGHSQIIFQPENYIKNKYTITEVMITVTQHFLHGICTSKGKALITEYNTQLLENSLGTNKTTI